MKKKLLLHICCAPDATYGIEFFSKDFDVTVFFYNPNIHPETEYRFRFIELKRVARRFGVPVIEGKYDPERWFNAVRGLEDEPEGGKRCTICFRLRLEETAKVAREQGFDAISTVLTISPKKDSELINRIGENVAKQYGLEWIHSNLKKGGGFKRSLELSSEFELYRQEYCGCIFSLWEAEHIRRVKNIERIEDAERKGDMILTESRFAGTPSETLFRKEIRDALEEHGNINLKEIEFRFMGWRPLTASVYVAKTGPSFKVFPWVYSASAPGRVRGFVSDVQDFELKGLKLKRIILTKGGIELMVRGDGPPVPFVAPDFPRMRPIASVDKEILNHLDKKLDVQMLMEFNERARSGILLAWRGEPSVAVTAPLDSMYSSPGLGRKAAALKLLDMAREGLENVLFAFSGAELINDLGFQILIEHIRNMFPSLKRIIRLKDIGMGNTITISRNAGFQMPALSGIAGLAVRETVVPSKYDGYEIAELWTSQIPCGDETSSVDERLSELAINLVKKLI